MVIPVREGTPMYPETSRHVQYQFGGNTVWIASGSSMFPRDRVDIVGLEEVEALIKALSIVRESMAHD